MREMREEYETFLRFFIHFQQRTQKKKHKKTDDVSKKFSNPCFYNLIVSQRLAAFMFN